MVRKPWGWTHTDAPNYSVKDRDEFPKFWLTASDQQKALVRNRQGRTCKVTEWALLSAMNAFGKPLPEHLDQPSRR